MKSTKHDFVEYSPQLQKESYSVPKMRYTLVIYLVAFQLAFILLLGVFGSYAPNGSGKYEGDYSKVDQVPKLYAMYQDVHVMMFIGFGFLMTFLKKYGYGSVGFNMLITVYVIEWALLIAGWLESIGHHGMFQINLTSLLVADFSAAAVLISFGAVLGKASLGQLILMATVEVVMQRLNEHIGLHFFHAYDVGESMYVHVFGAYFGLSVAKILHHKEVESEKEGVNYNSDLFAMIGTLFLWVFWPSFNSAVAVDEGQSRAIINTLLSITASCMITFVISMLVGKGKLNMVHVQNATLAGGVAVGTIADMNIQPFGAVIIGTVAGAVSTLGYQYLTPFLKSVYLHDTCGVNNLHGMPGLLSGVIGAIVAFSASRDNYYGNSLYKFYPSRIPAFNSTEYNAFNLASTDYKDGGLGRSANVQAGYQVAALFVTLGIAIGSGIITGFLMKIPIVEQVKDEKNLFEDELYWEHIDHMVVQSDNQTNDQQESNL